MHWLVNLLRYAAQKPIQKAPVTSREKTDQLLRVDDYQGMITVESRKWGEHLEVEASGEWHAWLDHPMIQELPSAGYGGW